MPQTNCYRYPCMLDAMLSRYAQDPASTILAALEIDGSCDLLGFLVMRSPDGTYNWLRTMGC